AQAREIIATVSAEKAANLPEQMVQNIANGRVQKFLKENTLENQDFVQSDEKVSVADYIKSVDKDAKVVAFRRYSLND
ncbi:MAG: elongation factor Ts, partial [Bacteroidales bacterium]|nr:elongation factor Ts [Bacteroidales bacterium]